MCACMSVYACVLVELNGCLTLFPKEHSYKHKQGQLCAGAKPYESTQIPKHNN